METPPDLPGGSLVILAEAQQARPTFSSLLVWQSRHRTDDDNKTGNKTHGDAEQGPLDGCPSILPPIDDQDESYVGGGQAGGHMRERKDREARKCEDRREEGAQKI